METSQRNKRTESPFAIELQDGKGNRVIGRRLAEVVGKNDSVYWSLIPFQGKATDKAQSRFLVPVELATKVKNVAVVNVITKTTIAKFAFTDLKSADTNIEIEMGDGISAWICATWSASNYLGGWGSGGMVLRGYELAGKREAYIPASQRLCDY